MKRRLFAAAALCSLMPWLAGCGGGDSQLSTVKAGGTVAYEDGSPLSGVRIELKPAEGKHAPAGNVDANGNFTLSTYDDGDGAPVGKYKVYFSTGIAEIPKGPDANAEKTTAGPGPPMGGGMVQVDMLVHQDFLSPESTTLEVTIPAEGNEKIKLTVKRPGR